ncbi:DUF1801 domain-containing protein [Pyxidicoccus fallax]|uniref:DUF1801 domain-containing protein n=1 Tax=Pyxidicoccus fallax TaxID=394095 RepID=A0A848LBE9_9BACT|nr:DUF1801 domain-containing protein [Pyxidicoccus fallax]NMO15824.1 DUF1801 domain-containing protein [Pyxidicoccus fallax]NPC79391.1 DUF1801 domain-containing protein [Pyxidicoccus fallax]
MPATTVAQYLASLPADRRQALEAVRSEILKNLPEGYEEGIHFGMIGYCIPLARFPDTYNGQPLMLAALASQKQYMSVYLMTVYGDPKLATWFQKAYAAAGKKLDMGKSCVRFKSLDALPVELIGEAVSKVSVDEYIAHYERVKGASSTRSATKKAAPRKAAPATKKAPARKRAASKAPSSKKAPARKPAAGKTQARKAPARQPTARKTLGRK